MVRRDWGVTRATRTGFGGGEPGAVQLTGAATVGGRLVPGVPAGGGLRVLPGTAVPLGPALAAGLAVPPEAEAPGDAGETLGLGPAVPGAVGSVPGLPAPIGLLQAAATASSTTARADPAAREHTDPSRALAIAVRLVRGRLGPGRTPNRPRQR
ncbi:MAG: hypothetical protein ACLGIF_01720 [Actinomycetes bacterium]